MLNQAGAVFLNCANCGTRMRIASDVSQFACASCGVTQLVERRGGAVHLGLVTEAIERIHDNSEKTVAELAYKRLSDDLKEVGLQLAALREELKKKHDFPIAISLMIFGPLALFGTAALIAAGHPAVIATCLSIGCGGLSLAYFYVAIVRKRAKPAIMRLEEEQKKVADKLAEKRWIIDT
jgi:hypothetical protein